MFERRSVVCVINSRIHDEELGWNDLNAATELNFKCPGCGFSGMVVKTVCRWRSKALPAPLYNADALVQYGIFDTFGNYHACAVFSKVGCAYIHDDNGSVYDQMMFNPYSKARRSKQIDNPLPVDGVVGEEVLLSS